MPPTPRPRPMPARAAPAPRWRRRAEARPEEILDAALAEFTERGFEAARMDDVARRAGLSKGGVYLYFTSKEALLKALIEAKMAPIAQMASTLAAAGAENPKAAIRAIAQNIAARIADPMNVAVPRLVIGVSARFPDIAAFYREQVVERARSAFESLIARGVARGEFRDIDPRAAVRAFIGPLLFEAMWTHVLGGDNLLAQSEALVDAHLDVLFHGIETERRA
jgi:AcrR family transcriptional regulator